MTDTSTTPDFESMPDEDISEIVSAGTATLARRQTVADADAAPTPSASSTSRPLGA